MMPYGIDQLAASGRAYKFFHTCDLARRQNEAGGLDI